MAILVVVVVVVVVVLFVVVVAQHCCCREELPKDLAKEAHVNTECRAVLNKVFPGYEAGR